MATSSDLLTLGFAGIDWIEHYLVHGPGDVQGQPIVLDDEFAAFVLKAYRVDGAGRRLTRRAFLSRSKGRSKSGLAAMVACFEALGPCRFDHFAEAGEVSAWGYEYELGEPVGRPLIYVEVLNVATEEGQAGNTYDAIYYMLNPETCSKNLLRDFGRVDVGLARTNLPDQRGFIEPVTSADSSKDGGKSTFIVADETHLWVLPRLKRLHGVMTRNLLKRKIASGWMLETSTMYGEGEQSVAEGTHSYAKAVAAGEQDDRTLLFDHKQASDRWNLDDPADRLSALAEAYGPAAEWMNLEAISASWDDPQVSEAEFRRYWLNQPVPTAPKVESVIPEQAWNECFDFDSTVISVPRFGLDVSPMRTWAAVAVAGKNAAGKHHLEVTSRGDLVDHREGVGWVIPRLRQLQEAFPNLIVNIAAGSGAESLKPDLEAAGITVEVLAGKEVAAGCGLMYDLAVSRNLAHVGQEELTKALFSAKKRVENGENAWIWGRQKSGRDITPIYAATVALWAANKDQASDYNVLDSVL